VLAAGIRSVGDGVEMIDVPGPRPLAGDEVLIQVVAAGVGTWDGIVRTGGWDVGGRPPMALGVEAAGVVAEVGSMVTAWAPADEVMTHPLPLRSASLVRPGGTLVTIAGPTEARPADGLAIDFVVEPDRAQLSEIVGGCGTDGCGPHRRRRDPRRCCRRPQPDGADQWADDHPRSPVNHQKDK
jgi:hypothetical protein